MMPRHLGNSEQPQNFWPAYLPLLAALMTISLPHLGQTSFVSAGRTGLLLTLVRLILFCLYELPFHITVHQTAAAKLHGCFAQIYLRLLAHTAVAHDAVDHRKDQDSGFFGRNPGKISAFGAF